MKRLLFLLALAALALPATALAKGPSEANDHRARASRKAITIIGPEEDGSPLMDLRGGRRLLPGSLRPAARPDAAGPAQGRSRAEVHDRLQGPGGDDESLTIQQDLYPYAQPYAVTYMTRRAEDLRHDDPGRLVHDATLKDPRRAGLPKTAAAAEARGARARPGSSRPADSERARARPVRPRRSDAR